MKIVSIAAALAAVMIVVAAASAAPNRPWFTHLNGAGKLVCDRGNNGVTGPFATRALCEASIKDDGGDDGDDGDGGGTIPPPPVTRVAPQVDRMGACDLKGRYVDLTNTQFFAGVFVDADGVTQKVVPANYLAGIGETCDNPFNLGFKPTGYKVTDGGTVYLSDTTFDVYPYWVRA